MAGSRSQSNKNSGGRESFDSKTSAIKQLYKTVRLRNKQSGELYIANLFAEAVHGEHFTTPLEQGRVVGARMILNYMW